MFGKNRSCHPRNLREAAKDRRKGRIDFRRQGERWYCYSQKYHPLDVFVTKKKRDLPNKRRKQGSGAWLNRRGSGFRGRQALTPANKGGGRALNGKKGKEQQPYVSYISQGLLPKKRKNRQMRKKI